MDTAMWLTIGGIAVLLLLSAFFSGSETALTAASRAKMHQLEQDGNTRAATVNRLRLDKERLIGAILLGNNLVNILASALATTLFIAVVGEGAVPIATVVMTLLVLVFSEVLPKTVAIQQSDRIALAVAPLLRMVVMVLAPITYGIGFLVRLLMRGMRLSTDNMSMTDYVDELRGAIELHRGPEEETQHERAMLRSILDLSDVEVGEIMTHRRNILAIDVDEPLDVIVEAVLNSPFTRIPLWRDDPDNVVGVLHAKDMLRTLRRQGALTDAFRESMGDSAPGTYATSSDASAAPDATAAIDEQPAVDAGKTAGSADDDRTDGDSTDNQSTDAGGFDLLSIAATPWFIPDSTSLLDQLHAFRKRREHFALVVDEYGSLQGVVTLEDILEEIVGDITDEHDIPVAGVRPQTNGSYIIDGTVTLRDLNRQFEWRLPDEEAATLAGLILHEARRIPNVGQSFLFHGFRFDILRRQRNQITLIRVTPPTPGQEEAPD
ncbi:HlyC/CorC family transporter [Fodinicurvata sp. EGI_FJ10296]|uniref:HlyC/CorC family transporter n=1 Tax=Fodinicurvata sp. EGI_FJ10296 TaxID=3231908 RepID=UPI0034573662